MNVEQAREVSHTANESVFAMIEHLDATHNCMPSCESILAVTASRLIFVCGFCLCGIKR